MMMIKVQAGEKKQATKNPPKKAGSKSKTKKSTGANTGNTTGKVRQNCTTDSLAKNASEMTYKRRRD